MAKQLDILALEPFYGGMRRSMLESVIRCSRHRWTLLRLPPRRIERRLAAASHWFAEQLTRHWVGHVDLLYTSEALNLADLFRLMPNLARKPSVVYFHSNQLPDVRSSSAVAPTANVNPSAELANLNTATAAKEIWFNSKYHQRAFLAGVRKLVAAHPEISGRDPLPELTAKSRFMPPPVDTSYARRIAETENVVRQNRTLFVVTRDANLNLLNSALGMVRRRGMKMNLLTVGPLEGLDPEVNRKTLSENDGPAQIRAMLTANCFLSTQITAPCDEHAIFALTLGCWPLLPKAGVYPELLPPSMHSTNLYDVSADVLANRLQDALPIIQDESDTKHLTDALHPFDAMAACKAIDERIEELVAAK